MTKNYSLSFINSIGIKMTLHHSFLQKKIYHITLITSFIFVSFGNNKGFKRFYRLKVCKIWFFTLVVKNQIYDTLKLFAICGWNIIFL